MTTKRPLAGLTPEQLKALVSPDPQIVAAACASMTTEQVLAYNASRESTEEKAKRNGKAAKPAIEIGVDELRVADEALAAIAREPDLYTRGGELVPVITDGEALRMRSLRVATLRERMADAATWLKYLQGGEQKPAHPPDWAVQGLYARGQWPSLRRLVAISRTPFMRPDGSLVTAPGHDAATAVLYAPRCAYPAIPARPTSADVDAAARALLDPLEQFPFVAESDRAAAVAAILAIVARPAIEGPVPMTVCRAPAAGTGKGLIADVISLAATGAKPETMTAARDDDEWRKRIISLSRKGPQVVLVDNVRGAFGNGVLEATLTAWPELSERGLGTLEMVTGPLQMVWLASGNNMTLSGDMPRRVVACDLDAGMESPEERTGWRYPSLREHVHREHPRLAAAALMILHAYHLAGRPAHGQLMLGSYEGWNDLIRGACIWAGIGDPDGARQRIREQADDERDALRAALEAWHLEWVERPITCVAAVQHAEGRSELQAALAGLVRGELTPRTLGNAIKRLQGRIAAGLAWREGPMCHGVRQWAVREAGGSGGLGGCVSPVQGKMGEVLKRGPKGWEETPETPETPRVHKSAESRDSNSDATVGAATLFDLEDPKKWRH